MYTWFPSINFNKFYNYFEQFKMKQNQLTKLQSVKTFTIIIYNLFY